jgi:hypothetical protein
MQPAAARVGPSKEPSVRRIAVRFSSGATICIEKTIKVQFFQVVCAINNKLFPSSSQEAGQRACAWRQEQKARQNSGIRNSMRGGACMSALIALRDLGGDSEISEAHEQHRIPPGCLKFSTGLIC